ncbi:MAG: sensory rhodopsin transducer [Oscillospiraceae bacterium]
MKWFIPDCFWPEVDNGDYVSHEAVCVLNTSTQPVDVCLTLFFEDREKLGGFKITIGSERTLHIRLDKLANDKGEKIPRGVPYAMVVECPEKIAVQYTRVDTTQPALSIATTIV